MIYILLIIVFSFVIYYLVNSLQLLSIVFCLGTVKAKKLKVIGKDIFFLRLTVLIALSILLASMIQIILGNQILYIVVGLSMFAGAFSSWRILKFDNKQSKNDI